MKLLVVILAGILYSCSLSSQQSNEKNTDSYSLDISQYGAVSVLAVDIESNEVIVELHPAQRMTPASLTKVITTGAALGVLESDFRFETQFFIKDNELIVKGKGDPTLGSDRFDETQAQHVFNKLLMAMQASGISSIDKIVVDNSFFSGIRLPSKRLWEDIGNYYGAVPNALTYKENTFYLTMKSPKGVGLPVEIVKTEPEVDVHLNCLVKTADNNKDSAYIYGYYQADQWYVSGSIPQDRQEFTIKGALPKPEITLADELKLYLNNNGIAVKGIEAAEVTMSEKAEPILVHYSPALKDIIAVVNKTSHNLFADHLMYQMALQLYGKADWDRGVKSLHEYWGEAIPGFTGRFFDGSGLSPFNAFSAHDMVQVLSYINATEEGEVFKETLSVAGVDGTLRSILKEDEFKGKLIGKSGSLNGVLCYCGYISTKGGKTIAFCMMGNRFTETYKEVRYQMEQLMKEIIVQN
ncbi:D-alanyl-D-alanine carboxypeptidase/D-alanyl-D-alanine endopeptidase [Carboxylicivirga sp. RSCT41]|uniref:D-alanyl-D-alanine carboxypeptidase/D-alanyl-D-alanine endopeptidase n=1 Tax=Carboxylicivirga agarovorans TaxID=3417570 RepID=UPI003D34AAA9